MSEPKPLGRPTKFNEALKEKMLQLFEKGKTDKQVAEIVGVHVRTIENWKGKHPDFLWALRESKQIADDLVEASLFSRAVGYSHPEEKIFQYEGEIIRAETTKHYPPESGAAFSWLKNRKPEQWREKQPGDGPDVQVNNYQGMSESQLDARIKELEARLNGDGEK